MNHIFTVEILQATSNFHDLPDVEQSLIVYICNATDPCHDLKSSRWIVRVRDTAPTGHHIPILHPRRDHAEVRLECLQIYTKEWKNVNVFEMSPNHCFHTEILDHID